MSIIQHNLFDNALQVLINDNTRADDWVNATKWCEYFGKQWAQIAKQPNFQLFLESLSTQLFGHSDKKSLYQINGKPKQTWVHPLVAIKLAEWLSPDFDLYVKQTFKRYLDGDITLADDIIQRSQSTKDLTWLSERLKGKITRQAFTEELKKHGVTGVGYAMNTNAIYKTLLGKTAQEIKEERHITNKDTTRDDMTALELTAINLAELAAMARMQKSQAKGNQQTTAISHSSAEGIRGAIADIL